MTGLLIKVEHDPLAAYAYTATLWKDGAKQHEGIYGHGDTSADAVEMVKARYRASLAVEDPQWFTWDPDEAPEPQSLKAV